MISARCTSEGTQVQQIRVMVEIRASAAVAAVAVAVAVAVAAAVATAGCIKLRRSRQQRGCIILD